MTDTDAKDVCRRFAGVERRDPHQPVDAGLALQVAVGVLAGDLERGRLDPRLVAGQQVHDLDLVAARAPSSACTCGGASAPSPGTRCRRRPAWMERMAFFRSWSPGQDDGQLELLQLLAQALDARLDLGLQALVGLLERHLPEGAAASASSRESSPVRPTRRERSFRSRTSRLGAPGVVPEPGARHLRVDGGDACLLRRQVKDAPEGRRAAARRPRTRAGARLSTALGPPARGEAAEEGGARQRGAGVGEDVAEPRV